jgi:hypothetical protein
MISDDYCYVEVWHVFEQWVNAGKIPQFSTYDLRHYDMDKLDHHIFKLFGLNLDNCSCVQDVSKTFRHLMTDKEIEWVFSPYAYAIYKAKMARMK